MEKTGLLVVVALTSVLSAACSGMSLTPKPSFGLVIRHEAMTGSTEKRGVEAVTDEGRILFSPSRVRPPTALGKADGRGGTSSYVGASVPKWVDVSWREGLFVQRYDSVANSMWTGGAIIAKYRIEVASRIPVHVLQYASQGKGRAIYLTFRIQDDGVLLAWSVQEAYGGLWAYSLHGGDFPCDRVSPHATRPTCTSGYLKDAPWYHP